VPEAASCLASLSGTPTMAGDVKGDLPKTRSTLVREGGRWFAGWGASGFELK
jgi:hypothetical protein